MTAPQRKAPGRIMFPAILFLGVKLAIGTDTTWFDLPWIARFCISAVAGVFITIGVIGTSRAYRL
jgi:hypothetical protein